MVRHCLYKNCAPFKTDWVNTDSVKDGTLCCAYILLMLPTRAIASMQLIHGQ